MINACNTVIFWHFLTRKWTVLSTTTLPYMPRVDFYDRRSKVARERKNCRRGITIVRFEGTGSLSQVQEFATFVASPNRRMLS